jgi:hypothetical protein
MMPILGAGNSKRIPAVTAEQILRARTGIYFSEDEVQIVDSSIGWEPELSDIIPTIVVHVLALTHGLPETAGYYGVDRSNREILSFTLPGREVPR